MGFNQRLFCQKLGWHKAPIIQDGCCSRCGVLVLQDSQGNWFEFSQPAPPMTNHPTQAGHTAELSADLIGDDAGLVEPLDNAMVPREVAESWKAKAENYQQERAELSARVAQLEAIAAKLAGALETIAGLGNTDADFRVLAKLVARQALTEYKDATDGK